MIKVITFTKTLNATEAGMTNTNDSYILIPQSIDGSLLFPKNGRYKVRDYISGEDFEFRYETGREQRVYKLGQYCRMNDVQCGDIITIEHRIINDNSRLFINARKKKNIVFLQKHKDGFLIIRNDLDRHILDKVLLFSINGQRVSLLIEFDRNIKKRKDSPDELPLYKITINGDKKLQDYIKASYIELSYNDMTIRIPEDVKLELINQQ